MLEKQPQNREQKKNTGVFHKNGDHLKKWQNETEEEWRKRQGQSKPQEDLIGEWSEATEAKNKDPENPELENWRNS